MFLKIKKIRLHVLLVVLKNFKNLLRSNGKKHFLKAPVTAWVSVFINIIQKFYSFILKAVLFFQKTMRVNSGMSLSNTGIYLRYSREMSQKNKNIL